jgi:hypothetical protein
MPREKTGSSRANQERSLKVRRDSPSLERLLAEAFDQIRQIVLPVTQLSADKSVTLNHRDAFSEGTRTSR